MQGSDGIPAMTWHDRLAAAEPGRLALWLAVALAAGAAAYAAAPFEPPGLAGPAAMLAGLLLAGAGRGIAPLRACGRLLLAGGLGLAAAQLASGLAPPLVELPGRATVVVGTVARVEALPEGRRVLLAEPVLDGGARLPRSLRIRLRADDGGAIAPGDVLRLRALVRPPAAPALPGGWDLQFDAFFAGIGGYGMALGPAERISEVPPRNLVARLRRVQEAIAGRVAAALPGSTGAIAAALMIGTATAIPAAELAAFRDSGLAHLLSISGLHLGIAMGLAFAAVRLLVAAWEWGALRLPGKAIAAVAALAAGGAYTLLTGAEVPMLRSFGMAALVTLGVLAGRRAITLRAWALALAVVTLLVPHEVVRPGFQMSFAAVLALVAGFEAARPWLLRLEGDLAWWRRVLRGIAALVLASTFAGTATLPIAAAHFGVIQVYYILANLVAVPLTALWVMPAAVIALLLMPIGIEWAALIAMGWGVDLLRAIGAGVAAWPAASLRVPAAAPWGLVVYVLGLAWLGLWRSRLRLAGVALIAAGLAAPLVTRPPDLLISADARLIGLVTPAGLQVQRASGGSAFVLDSWLRSLGARDWTALPAGGSGSAGLACSEVACRFQPPAATAPALVLRRGEIDPAGACAAAVVVSPEPLRLECRPPIPVIDRFGVWRRGAHAVWLGPSGVVVVADRDRRGTRPWVIPLPTRTRQPPGPPLPPADVDPIPDPVPE